MLAFTAALALPPAAAGFGKNKVQYQYMNWNYYEAPHFSLYFHQDMGELPATAYFWLGDMYGDLSRRFGFTHTKSVPVVLYESSALFEQTNIITQILPEEVGGFTEVFKNRIALPFNGSMSDLRHVLHHELLHAFVFGIIFDGNIFKTVSAQVPLWFNEGLAEVLSTGWNREADMFMLDRVLHSFVPLPSMLDGYMAYKGGQSFLYYLMHTGGDSLFNRMLREFSQTGMAERSIEIVYKKSLEELGKDWINQLRRMYWPEIGRRMEPARHASAITDHVRDRSRFNQRPRISPDGQSIAFFSDRKDFINIIIADTAGRTRRHIGRHSLSGSFESFQPMSGAIVWSPDGQELAFVAKKAGRNEIRVVNARTGRTRYAIRPELSAVNGLDWSRDGSRLVMTGIFQGRTDLYMYDFNTRELARLTNSPETKESPRFSPDGKSVIFAVTDTAGLGTGPFLPATDPNRVPPAAPRPTSNIALFDIEAGTWRQLANTRWNDKQPAFSPDGEFFVFVSDRNGINNLYISNINNPAAAHPLTDYTGGCGNPDWAADGSAIVYDVFAEQAWNIWRMTGPQEKVMKDSVLELTRWAMFEDAQAGEFFDYRNSISNANSDSTAIGDIDNAGDVNNVTDTNAVNNINDDNDSGNTANISDTLPTPQPYTLRFSPDMVIFGLGVSTYSGVFGQAMAAFSDIMGDHRITLAGDLQFDFTEYAQIYAAYQYLKLRVNLIGGGFYYKYYAYDGFHRQAFHDLETGGFAGAAYPFSMFSRVDAQLFGRHITRTPVASADESRPTMPAITHNSLLALFGYSFDNILWGITGPLRGFRGAARLHVAAPFSFTDEGYLSGEVDARHYSHLFRTAVWANRVTFGGTIGLGDNRAARRFFMGGDNNWFNYRLNYDNYDSNLEYSYYSDIVSPLRGWNYFDLTGDRMLLMNSELRFPFIREISTVMPIPMRIRYINGAVFMDAGYAWTHDEQNQKHLPIPPKLVAGYGFGMRANLGIFVLRYDRGWPTDWKTIGRPINYFSFGAEF